MKIEFKVVASASALALLSGCAIVPSVSRPYFFPEGRADIVVTQTLGCMVTDIKKPPDPGNKPLVRSAATASVAYTYVANYASTKKHALNVSDIDFLLSDSDVAISVTEDGRLSTINSNNTGEASAIVKSIISVAAVFTGIKPLVFKQPLTPQDQQIKYCQTIIQYGTAVDASKQPGLYTLTLSYKQRLLFPQGNTITDANGIHYTVGNAVPIPLDPGSTPFKTDAELFPSFSFTMNAANNTDIQPAWTDDKQAGPHIEVPTMMLLAVQMSGPVADMSQIGDFWNDTWLAPTDTPVNIPLPKAPWFGKLNTTLQFSGSGLVNKVEYNKTNGLADLFSSGSQIVNQAFPPAPAVQTTAQKAADVQAHADLIYQQQRLISCQLDPKNCSSK